MESFHWNEIVDVFLKKEETFHHEIWNNELNTNSSFQKDDRNNSRVFYFTIVNIRECYYSQHFCKIQFSDDMTQQIQMTIQNIMQIFHFNWVQSRKCLTQVSILPKSSFSNKTFYFKSCGVFKKIDVEEEKKNL